MQKHIAEAIKTSEEFICPILLDIDETLVISVHRWLDYIKGRFGLILSLDELRLHGGTENYFRNRRPDLFDNYYDWAETLRGDLQFNTNLPTIPGAREGVNELSRIPGVGISAYLTSRPEHIAEITSIELSRAGFPQLPIIARPIDTQIKETTSWKISVLEQFSLSLKRKISIVDDSVALASAIAERNTSSCPLQSILYLGPITDTSTLSAVSIDKIQMASWEDIPRIFSDPAKRVH